MIWCPLQDVLELIDGHFNNRQSLTAAEAELEQREIQFRGVQKRLLVRYQVGDSIVEGCMHSCCAQWLAQYVWSCWRLRYVHRHCLSRWH